MKDKLIIWRWVILKADIGLIGLAVMGQNLALNIARKGYNVAVYNRSPKRTEDLLKRVKDEKITPAYELKEFIDSLQKPRKIILMVKAGNPVDQMIEQLLPYLEKGDLIIDGGNSHYLDTNRRLKELSEKGILFLGMGVSGGEYGALHGPSLMPGGSKEAYEMVEEILLKIAAKSDEGPCCTYVGNTSAGHFVKMVHNGIEYAIMQAIAETYDIMRKILKMDVKEIGDVFENWNKGELNSFLIEITYKIMRKIDEETGKPLVNLILDKAEQKGTGKWTAQAALDLGIPTPSLNFALIARVISNFKEDRVNLSKIFEKRILSVSIDKVRLLEDLEKALLFSIFISFSQGLWLISQASDTYDYGINLSEVTRIWKNGCIIRAKMLDFLKNILEEDKSNVYLLKSEKALSFLKEKVDSVINVTEVARKFWVPTPVLNSSLDFLFSMIERNLPANLIQAQRDFFGAHTFERIDKEGIFHVEWIELD